MAFKFSDYKFPVDKDFDGFQFVKMEEIAGTTITIGAVVKFQEKVGEDGKTKTAVRFCFKDQTGKLCYTYSTSYGIAGVLKNIVDSEGVVPQVPVQIVTVPTKNGKSTYEFADVEVA